MLLDLPLSSETDRRMHRIHICFLLVPLCARPGQTRALGRGCSPSFASVDIN